MSKTLSITLSANDKASPDVLKLAANVLKVGSAADKATGGTLGWLSKLKSSLGGVKGLLVGVAGAFSVGLAVSSFNDAADALDNLNDVATRTGLSSELLSTLKYAAGMAGVEFEALAGGVATMEKNVSQFARTGGGKAADSIKALGIAVTDSSGRIKDINDLLPEFVDALARVDDAQTQVELSQRIFGNSDFLSFIKDGGDGLKRMAEEAKKLGVVFDSEQLQAAAAYNDSIDRVKAAWMGLRAKIVTEIGPALAGLMNTAAGFVASAPTILANAVTLVRSAMAGTLGPAQVEALQRIGDNLKKVVSSIVKATISTAVDLAFAGIKAIPAILGPAMDSALYNLIIIPLASVGNTVAQRFSAILSGLSSALNAFAQGDPLTALAAKSAGSAASYADSVAVMTQSIIQSARILDDDAVYALKQNLQGVFDNVQIVGDDQARAFEDLKTGIRSVALEVDGLLDVTATVQSHAIDVGETVRNEIEQVPIHVSTAAEAVKREVEGLRDFVLVESNWTMDALEAGIGDGILELQRMTADLRATAAQAFVSIAQGISTTMGTAVTDVLSGAKSMKDAFRDFASSTFKNISAVITQLLVMRAIAGIAGSLASSPNGWQTAKTPSGPFIGSFPGDFGAKTGGRVVGRGVLHFAGGGMVPGPRHIRADVVPALLAPGEMVLSRRAVDSMGVHRAMSLNRGGGSGDVNVSVSIGSISTGGSNSGQGDVASIKAVVVGAVLEALDTRPGVRAQIKARLA